MANVRNSKLPSCLRNIEFTENLESQYELLDCLIANGCLTTIEVETLKQLCTHRGVEECNRKLVENINESNFDLFLEGLWKSNQSHLVNYIVHNGIKYQPDDEEWPLNKSDKDALGLSYDAIVQQMDSRSIVDKLISKQCINGEQVSIMAMQATNEERNRKLMQIMYRKSFRQFGIFLECLKEDHYHLWETLSKDLFRLAQITKDSPKLEASFASDSDTGHLVARKKWTTIIESNIKVAGITIVDDKIFLIKDASPVINVYDSHSLTLSRNISVDMIRPCGIAGSKFTKALYVIDSHRERNCIHKVDLIYGFVSRLVEFRTKNHWPWGISVTSNQTILVTVHIEDAATCLLAEYLNDGTPVHEIALDSSIQHTNEAVKLSDDQFIVSHGMKNGLAGAFSKHRVCLVNSGGRIVKYYGSDAGRNAGQLDTPQSITLDKDNKRMYVADFDNDRVIILDYNLAYLGEINADLLGGGFNAPRRLHFDSATDRLFVGEFPPEHGRLLVINT